MKPLFLAIALVFAVTGCKSSPNAIAYKTTAVTVATVDTAMQAWGTYVRAERARVATLAPDAAVVPAAQLAVIEGKVRVGFAEYQKAVFLANTGLSVADGSPVSPAVAAAAASLIQTIYATIQH